MTAGFDSRGSQFYSSAFIQPNNTQILIYQFNEIFVDVSIETKANIKKNISHSNKYNYLNIISSNYDNPDCNRRVNLQV